MFDTGIPSRDHAAMGVDPALLVTRDGTLDTHLGERRDRFSLLARSGEAGRVAHTLTHRVGAVGSQPAQDLHLTVWPADPHVY